MYIPSEGGTLLQHMVMTGLVTCNKQHDSGHLAPAPHIEIEQFHRFVCIPQRIEAYAYM